MLASLSALSSGRRLAAASASADVDALCEQIMAVLREPPGLGKSARLQTASFALLRQVAQAEGPGRFRLPALDGDAVITVTHVEELRPVAGRPGQFRGTLRVNPRRGEPQSWLFTLIRGKLAVTAEPGNY